MSLCASKHQAPRGAGPAQGGSAGFSLSGRDEWHSAAVNKSALQEEQSFVHQQFWPQAVLWPQGHFVLSWGEQQSPELL